MTGSRPLSLTTQSMSLLVALGDPLARVLDCCGDFVPRVSHGSTNAYYCTTASAVFDDVIRELGALRGLRAIQFDANLLYLRDEVPVNGFGTIFDA